jgi:hypothetical protein
MTYALLDDRFYDHEKIMALLDRGDEGLAAVGVWSLCLAWAKAHADPAAPERAGRLNPARVRRIAGDTGIRLAPLLTEPPPGFEHGLWDGDGDGGWVIHDFTDWQQFDLWRQKREAGAKGGRTKAERMRAEAAAAGQGEMHLGVPEADELAAAVVAAGANGRSAPASSGDGSAARLPATSGRSSTATPPASSGELATGSSHLTSPHLTSPHLKNQVVDDAASRSSPTSVTPAGAKREPHRIPPDFAPDETSAAYAKRTRPDVDLASETARFKGYWQAKPGKAGEKKDWQQTWRNWISRSRGSALPAPQPGPGDDVDPAARGTWNLT